MTPRITIPESDLRVGDLMYVAGHGHRVLELRPYPGPADLYGVSTEGWRIAACEDEWGITLTGGSVEIAARP